MIILLNDENNYRVTLTIQKKLKIRYVRKESPFK